jgi:hypothetical protein
MGERHPRIGKQYLFLEKAVREIETALAFQSSATTRSDCRDPFQKMHFRTFREIALQSSRSLQTFSARNSL